MKTTEDLMDLVSVKWGKQLVQQMLSCIETDGCDVCGCHIRKEETSLLNPLGDGRLIIGIGDTGRWSFKGIVCSKECMATFAVDHYD